MNIKALIKTILDILKIIGIAVSGLIFLLIGSYIFLVMPLYLLVFLDLDEKCANWPVSIIYFIEIGIIVGIIGVRKLYKYNIEKDCKIKNADNSEIQLKYSFINNAILLTMNTIERNGFYEVWRQQNDEHSIQILCFNEEKQEFQAFDRFHWMDEPRIVSNPPSDFVDEKGCTVHCDSLEADGTYYNEDLWTPIKLHYTIPWLKQHMISF